MQRKNIEKIYAKKINELKKYDKAYFKDDKPLISDKKYDDIRNEILDLEKKYKYLNNLNSPSNKIGYKPSNKFKKIEHDIPMLSLANAFSKENIEDFLKKIKNFLNIKDSEKIVFSAEPKIDGISASLKYIDGIFTLGLSRGDGKAGEDITNNLKTIRDIPKKINKSNFPKILDVRGEVYISKSDFKKIAKQFANPRNAAGILDASTLGKIDIQGSDTSEFLNRVYTNAWSKLAIGKCRYGLMLNDDGMVYDDGVTTRLGENHYIMTTTTGGAASVMSNLEDFLQTEWPELNVYLTSVTDHFATVSVCGPHSKKILEKVVKNVDFSDQNFPHMSFKEGMVDNIKCRVMRISFTGELSYEINIQSNFGQATWKKCMDAGKEFKITPYGTEAMHLLRAEKGFIIAGQETDGTITPVDLQMDWIISKKKYDFIGKRSLYRSDTMRENRKQLVGLLTDDPKEILEEGAQIVEEVKNKPPMVMLGHVTSSYYSPNLNKSIALAVIKNGKKLKGKKLFVPMPNKTIKVSVSDTVFLDKEGNRLNA